MNLAAVAAGRDNNFQLIRLAAATAVVVYHSFALLRRFGDDPLLRVTGAYDLGALGVHTFFFVSGFLVAKSWCERHGVVAFAAARVLRIYPALVVATLFGVVLAARSSTLPLRAFLSSPQSVDYVLQNATGWSVRYTLPGAFASNPYAGAVNGSLWTLPIELRCYVGLALLGVVGALARRRLLAGVLATVFVAVAIDSALFPIQPNIPTVRYCVLLVGLGALAYAWRDRVVLSIPAAALVAALMLWNPGRWAPGVLYCAALGYVTLVVAYHPRLRMRSSDRIGDYSYGLYVYSFPIQQTVIESLAPSDRSPLVVFALAAPVALAAAMLSWHALEKPALALKRRLRVPERVRAAPVDPRVDGAR
jgi:peptidoglycan/LPS O-acetylase OafA/YrhL